MSVDWFAVYQTTSGSSTNGGTTNGGTTAGTTTGTTTGTTAGTTTGTTAGTTAGTTGGGTTTPDYTANVTKVSASQAKISFTPTTPAQYVDVHYLVGGGGQQNFRMANSGGTWTQTVSGLSSGSTLTYWFTYEKSGPQYDTPHYSYTQT